MMRSGPEAPKPVPGTGERRRRTALRFLHELGAIGFYTADVAQWGAQAPRYGGEILEQMVRVAWGCLPIVVAVSAFVGSTLAVEGFGILKELGGEDMVGRLIGVVALREVGPIIAAIMIGAQVGTSITAELATMRIQEEIDALESMSINPYQYLAVPRILGALAMVPLLVVVADLVMVLSGAVTAVLQLGVSPGQVRTDLVEFVTLKDLTRGMVKGVFFGLDWGIVCTYFGFRPQPGSGGSEAVGRASNLAMVSGSIVVALSAYIFTEYYYGVAPSFG